MYKNCLKRVLDFIVSLLGLLVLSPMLVLLMAIGTINMKGNPFFIQKRPGKNEKIFRLIKFRTMTCEKDSKGNLLPDEKRLTKYGEFLRKTSLDELPELFNILLGDMSIIGPRPLLVQYLPLYNTFQKRRHEVRPGLTGLAQVEGRNSISWEKKFQFDVYYVNHISLALDLSIFFKTIIKVIHREGISQDGQATMEFFTGSKEGED